MYDVQSQALSSFPGSSRRVPKEYPGTSKRPKFPRPPEQRDRTSDVPTKTPTQNNGVCTAFAGLSSKPEGGNGIWDLGGSNLQYKGRERGVISNNCVSERSVLKYTD
jgi:hypothetical protein